MRKIIHDILFALALLAAAATAGCGAKTNKVTDAPGPGNASASGGETMESTIKGLKNYGIADVSLTDPYLANAFSLEVKYLLSFDPDRWLAGFRETAGLDTLGKTRYPGWESSLIGGHAFGHYISACALATVSPDISENDRETLKNTLAYIIDGLKECQENSKGKPGFIFCSTILSKSNVELQFDNVEQGKTNITTQAWVPWYTMHKLIQGAIDVYAFTGIEAALDIAKGLGDWVYERTSGWSSAVRARTLSTEYGGMNDCLYELYALTGDDRYAAAAHVFDEDTLFKRVLAGGANSLNNLHANTTIPKFIGALKRYYLVDGKTVNGQTVDASEYLEYAKAFFETVRDRHTYITGGNSEWEHFGADGILDKERTNCNNETCNVYNMLKLAKLLFMITGDVSYADFYENAYINSILSSQNPVSGMTTYFQPMATGYFKVYGEPFTKFWCCTGTGMENFTKLGDSIYFSTGDRLYVNLYLSSVLDAKDLGLTLTQDSGVLYGKNTTFTVSGVKDPSKEVTLCFRIPDWAAGDITISLNGKDIDGTVEGGFISVKGAFKDKDIITVNIPMALKAFALPDNGSSIGFKYGPLVLSAGLGTEDMTTTTTGVNVTIPMTKIAPDEYVVLPDGKTTDSLLKDPSEFFDSDVTALEFTFKGTALTFTPHYSKYNERYGIYWYFVSKEEYDASHAVKKQSTDTVIDTVQPGYGQYENDDLHRMDEYNTVSVTNDGTYRYALPGGSFSYNFAVDKTGDNYLSLTLRKDDNGKTLRIKAGSTLLFEDTLDYIGTAASYELRVPIPAEVTNRALKLNANGESHDVVCITFSAADDRESAKVCDFIHTLTAVKNYETDDSVAYFVNCGDHDVFTPADGEKFGIYNSVMEQLYGYDAVTGMKWGLIDDPTDRYGGSSVSKAIYTANTWAYEYNTADDLPKEDTCRYTKNQYENGIKERYLDYYFELPDGTYTLEIGFSNPWSCSNRHDVYINIGKDDEKKIAGDFAVTGEPLKATVEVTGGYLTVNFRNATSSGLAINVTYIKISFAN